MKRSAVVDLMLSVEHEIGWESGAILRGINVKRDKSEYMMVISVLSKDRKALVSFISGSSVYACYEQLAAALYTTSITLRWYPDKYFGT